MTREEKEIALYCLKASSDYHSEVCEECVKYPNCDHTIQDDVTETIIKALEQEPCEDAISLTDVFEIMGDLMSIPYDFDRNITEKDISESMDKIRELPRVTPQEPRWIPVSERLPEESGYYFVTLETKSQIGSNVTSLGYFFGKEIRWMKSEDTVIAWQPLPMPYKESEGV